MQDVLVVHGHDSHNYVGERSQNLISRKLGSRLYPALDELVEVALGAVLHDDEDAIAVAEVLVELDDGGAFQHLQEGYLSVRCLLVLAIHIV